MKKILLCLILGVHFLSFAQNQVGDLKVYESEAFKDKFKSDYVTSFNTSESGEIVVLRQEKKRYILEVFDKNYQKLNSTIIASDKREWYVDDLFHGDELKFFTVFKKSKRAKEREVYCHTYNIKSNVHKKIKLFTTTIGARESLFSRSSKNKTNFRISPNEKFFVVMNQSKKKKETKSVIRVFDANSLELVYKTNHQNKVKNHYSQESLHIDNLGVVYSLRRKFLDGKYSKTLKGNANYQFVLNRISDSENKELIIKLKEDEHIKSLVISAAEKQLNLVGFYSGKNISRIKGGCSFIVDLESFIIKDRKTTALPLKVYEDLYSAKRAASKKKKSKELRNFDIDYTLKADDGSVYLLAEEFYTTQTYVSNGTMGGYWVTVYHYDDVLILKFNKAGEVAWGRSIYKKSTVPSYNAFLKSNKLHVILNTGKNLKKKSDGRVKASRGWFESTALYNFEYSDNGEVQHHKIQDNKGNTFYHPWYGAYKADKFMMMSLKKRKRRFMILE